jgi:hypothetical protein
VGPMPMQVIKMSRGMTSFIEYLLTDVGLIILNEKNTKSESVSTASVHFRKKNKNIKIHILITR